MHAKHIAILAALAIVAGASPVAFEQTSPPICSWTAHEPSSWDLSGAAEYMQKMFDTYGTEDWLTRMDQRRGDASKEYQWYDSVLDCKRLGGSTCVAPQKQCEEYTNPEERFIGIAAVNAYDYLDYAYHQLLQMTIEDGLKIEQIIADFAPDDPALGFNKLPPVASGNFIASSAAGFTGLAALSAASKEAGTVASVMGPYGAAVGAVLGLVGGGLFMANSMDPPVAPVDDTDMFETTLDNQLRGTFKAAADGIETINAMLFGGVGGQPWNLSDVTTYLQTQNLLNGTDGLHPISAVFSSGVFLSDPETSTLIKPLKAGFARVTQSLVAGILRANGYYIFTDTSSESCRSEFSIRYLVNGVYVCVVLSKRAPEEQTPDTMPLPAEMFLKLQSLDPDYGYGVVLRDLYDNALDCQDGQLNTTIILASGLPKCFWGLPVISGYNSVCSVIDPDMAAAFGYSAALKLTKDYCPDPY